MNKNPFDILGLDNSASTKDIKKAYFQQVKQFTPEKHAQEFKQVRQAYDLLKDDERRMEVEVFSFTQPPKKIEAKVPLPTVELKNTAFLSWMKNIQIDLGHTDFSGDFNDI